MAGVINKIEKKQGKVYGGFKNIINLFNNLSTDDKKEREDEELLKELKHAHTEWKNAETYFHSVAENDLIDHAIYNMEAAKRKYMYLLKKAREKDLRGNV
ncbi:MAG: DUF2508 family protein [Firmicutes bacterium]|nr:DUF2508 family protein [Bacillota bacterium]